VSLVPVVMWILDSHHISPLWEWEYHPISVILSKVLLKMRILMRQ